MGHFTALPRHCPKPTAVVPRPQPDLFFSKYEAQPRRYRHPTRIATAMLPRPQLQKHFTHIKAHGLLMFDLMLAPAWLHHDKESHVGMHSRHGCCLRCLSCRCSFLFPRSLHHRSGQLPFLVCLMRLHNKVKLVLLRNLAIPRALGISSLQNWAMLSRSYRGATAKLPRNQCHSCLVCHCFTAMSSIAVFSMLWGGLGMILGGLGMGLAGDAKLKRSSNMGSSISRHEARYKA